MIFFQGSHCGLLSWRSLSLREEEDAKSDRESATPAKNQARAASRREPLGPAQVHQGVKVCLERATNILTVTDITEMGPDDASTARRK
jgi:hypothetical protein